MADRFESSQEDPDHKSKPANHKQPYNQYDKGLGKAVSKGLLRADGKQPEITTKKQKRKFMGNCFVCGKPGHQAEEHYNRASAAHAKGKSNMAQGSPKQENE